MERWEASIMKPHRQFVLSHTVEALVEVDRLGVACLAEDPHRHLLVKVALQSLVALCQLLVLDL